MSLTALHFLSIVELLGDTQPGSARAALLERRVSVMAGWLIGRSA